MPRRAIFMVFRLFLLLLSQATLGLLGGAWLGWPGAVGGVVLAALLMLALDSWRAGRVLRWLGQADVTDVPVLRGLWGEAAYRALRALRAEQQKTRDSDERLREFVSAIQASPNGVILLDPDGRIEWCNDIAARHFGIDPQRDLLQHIGKLVREPAFAAYYAGKRTTNARSR